MTPDEQDRVATTTAGVVGDARWSLPAAAASSEARLGRSDAGDERA